MPFSWNDVVLHLAYLIFALAYAQKDVFRMRILLISGATVDMSYRYFLANEVSWTDVAWCIGDVLINAYQLFMLYRERRGLRFTDEEKQLHKMVFSNIGEIQFKRLLNLAEWQTIPEHTVLVEQGTHMASLIVIYDGLAKVEIDGSILSYLRNGNFVGEMSFVTGNLTTACVTTVMACRVLSWDRTLLREMMAKDEEMRNSMHSVFNGDLISKLIKQTNTPSGPTTSSTAPAPSVSPTAPATANG